MSKYIIKRILALIPLVFCVIFIVFSILNVVPGNPGRNVLGISATDEAVKAFNDSIGYNNPFFFKFFSYMKGIVTEFDFGTSYYSGKSVLAEIGGNFIYTFRLTMLGCSLYVIIGIPLGILAAIKQYSTLDNVVRVMSTIIACFPSFWLGMMGILVFSLWLGVLPSNGVDTWKHYILPVTVFGLGNAASLARLTRTIMLETIRQDYIRTARAKGVAERTVIWEHAFKNAMLPIITSVGVSIGMMMGGTMVSETIFSMPGLGMLAFNAIQTKDVPIVMGTTIFLSIIFCLIVLLVDIVSAYVDPRVKVRYSK